MISNISKFIAVILLLVLSLGFRTFDEMKTFAVDNSSLAKTKVFVDFDFGTTSLENDLPSGDVLFGTGPILVSQAMTSVFSDFNSIAASYVQLVGTSDTDYTAESSGRVITIRKAATSGLSGGEAKLEFDGNRVIGCSIIVKPDMYDSAKGFVRVITHEIGHCLGLDHPQETVNSVMSYFSKDAYRLQIDDKMGITYLYPTDSGKAAEKANFGLACARSE